MKTRTKKQYENYLNDFNVPESEKKSEGGRIPDKSKLGTWLRKHDPIAFMCGYREFLNMK